MYYCFMSRILQPLYCRALHGNGVGDNQISQPFRKAEAQPRQGRGVQHNLTCLHGPMVGGMSEVYREQQ
jgi:hypothetical protein